MTTQATNRPVHTLRSGSIKAANWMNEPVTGGTYYAVTFSRGYQSDGNWHDTQSFGASDLLDLRRVTTAAENWIAEQPV